MKELTSYTHEALRGMSAFDSDTPPLPGPHVT